MPSTPSFKLQLAATRKPRPQDSELVFGRTFTDHMAIADWESERGWFDPRVVPLRAFSLDPAAAVFHYAQEMFDGLKAFRGADGKIRFFRLDRHCKRYARRGERLCIPAIDEALMREAILSARCARTATGFRRRPARRCTSVRPSSRRSRSWACAPRSGSCSS
jgi:branched-chain amino acid aminotransferase